MPDKALAYPKEREVTDETIYETCPRCEGTGIEKYGLGMVALCADCNGDGVVEHRCDSRLVEWGEAA